MTGLSKSRNARVSWLVGVALALTLAVVMPIHLNRGLFPTCGSARTGLHAAHHTIIDRIGGRLEARIDQAGRAPAPESATVAMVFAMAAPCAPPRATCAPPRTRKLRRLRTGPARADNGDPFSHTAFLRV